MSDQKNEKDIDAVSGIDTTGHEWDGIKELNNPLPRWWVWMFYATIVWAIGYMIWFPSIPLINDAAPSISGETNRGKLKETLANVEAGRADIETAILTTDLEAIRTNDDLFRYANAGGGALFRVHCTQCHGTGAQGGPGYPNLSDDDWLWGGDLQNIAYTITHGVRNEQSFDSRFSEMPAFGDDYLESGDIRAVAEYVLALSAQEHDVAKFDVGGEIFANECASCHGEMGEGNRELGAPNLADALWLYGGSRSEIAAQISAPRHGVMPAWGEPRLSEADVKKLAIYVHALGGGEAELTEED